MRRGRFLGNTLGAVVFIATRALAQGAAALPPASAPPASTQPASAPPAENAPVQLAPQYVAPSPPSPVGARPPTDAATPSTSAAIAEPDTHGAAMRAYQAALAAQKLGGSTPLTIDALRTALADAESKIAAGRRDEAIGDLVYLVESRRFDPFRGLDEGRDALFLLGDALGRAGATGPARGYLVPLLSAIPTDIWARRAAQSLVDMGLDGDHPEVFLEDLKKLAPGAPEELSSDIAYLAGRAAEHAGKDDEALAAFAKVTPRSRFWAQATYLSGLIETGRGHLKQGERQFCKVADVHQTPRDALAFGGGDFFEVRDLSRLGLGRLAHEQYRFDDSRYYYYLVPGDSVHLSEALYESANSRYEAKDYRGARDLLDQMRARGDMSRYDDEVWVFDAYVDLALCNFPSADEKLKTFIARYEPVRDAARRTASDPRRLADVVDAVRTGTDPEALGTKADRSAMGSLSTALRGDPDYGRAARNLAKIDYQLSGLRQAMVALDDAKRTLANAKDIRPRGETLEGTSAEQNARIDSQLAELRRLLQHVKASGEHAADAEQAEQQLATLEARAKDASQASGVASKAASVAAGLPGLASADRERASALYVDAEKTRGELLRTELGAAKDALGRLDLRLSRLLRRARLGRIETVLGKKRALETEIEALTEGFLPEGAVDSLEAARYLRDDEEYWPYDGEDWADEYVGGEGLE